MPSSIPRRLLWAVDTLTIQPDDHILEIGCGHGVAVSLICDRLDSGTITAIDRSEKMIAAAAKRNQPHIDSGKATFHTAALDTADFGGARFNKIFAVNVNVFWLDPAPELAALKRLLAPGGMLYLFYEPPAADKAREIAEKASDYLHARGFTVEQVLYADLDSMRGVCITATQENK